MIQMSTLALQDEWQTDLLQVVNYTVGHVHSLITLELLNCCWPFSTDLGPQVAPHHEVRG